MTAYMFCSNNETVSWQQQLNNLQRDYTKSKKESSSSKINNSIYCSPFETAANQIIDV